jgi:phosphoglucosamine mutase
VPAVEEIDGTTEYLTHLAAILAPGARPSGLRIVVDCANGATTRVAPELFRRLGIDAHVIGASPDGRNINLGCGSTAPDLLSRTVLEGGYSLGVAFDGDGDRAIFVDGRGHIVDGDAVMLMCAIQLKKEGRLAGHTVVATVMSNLGLELALRDAGIDLVRTPVGDKHVMEEMMRRGLSLGGEQSGHVIFADHLFTGDGLATALYVLRTMASTGRALHELAADLRRYPQVLMNLRVPRKVDLDAVPAVAAAMSQVRSRLSGEGRLLVRYSGTEPLLRVMIEGRDEAEIRRWGQEIIDAARQHLGTG